MKAKSKGMQAVETLVVEQVEPSVETVVGSSVVERVEILAAVETLVVGEAEILAAAVVAASSRSSYKFVTLADGAHLYGKWAPFFCYSFGGGFVKL